MKKILVSLLLLSATGGLADTNFKLMPNVIDQQNAKAKGWDSFLGLGFYGTLSESNNVAGKDDGQSTTLGLKLDGSLDYGRERIHWLSQFNLLVAYSRNPLFPQYLKSEDRIELDTLFKNYFATITWAGLFSQANVTTAGLEGFDTQAVETTYRVKKLDGTEELLEANRFRLSDGFSPIKVRESLGVIASPFRSDLFSWDIKLGIGFRQVIADGQFVLQDDSKTVEREIVEIQSFEKYGYELGSEIKGHAENKKVIYSLKGVLLLPAYESLSTKDSSLFRKRLIDISGKASFHLLEWASVDYILTVSRDPAISEKSQTSQSLLFSINHVFAERKQAGS